MRLRKKNLLSNFMFFDPRSLTKLEKECVYWKAKAKGERLARMALLEDLDSCQWISVDDRLPENSTVVLTYDRGGIGMQLFYNCFEEDTDSLITHWQPLPAIPRGKSDG